MSLRLTREPKADASRPANGVLVRTLVRTSAVAAFEMTLRVTVVVPSANFASKLIAPPDAGILSGPVIVLPRTSVLLPVVAIPTVNGPRIVLPSMTLASDTQKTPAVGGDGLLHVPPFVTRSLQSASARQERPAGEVHPPGNFLDRPFGCGPLWMPARIEAAALRTVLLRTIVRCAMESTTPSNDDCVKTTVLPSKRLSSLKSTFGTGLFATGS